MGTVLILFAYLCYAIFLSRIFWRIYLFTRATGDGNRAKAPGPGKTFLTALRTARDLVFLTRLFRTNPLLWFGEWFFHAAFILVLARHLRYVFQNVPVWLVDLNTAGIIAGYVLPVSLAYILIVKSGIEKRSYFSTHNFFLLFLLFVLSITGILMRKVVHPDIIDIKLFTADVFAFRTGPAPDSVLFIVHFVTAFVFLAYLPTHIFAVPFTALEARRKEDGLYRILHER